MDTSGYVRFPDPRSDPWAAGLPGETWDLLERMPKAELHLHLDGSLRLSTALELARTRGVEPGLDTEAIQGRLIGPEQAEDQITLLEAFDLPIALLQDAEALERVTAELVEDVATDGTRYAEIRWAPSLHTARGLGLRDGIAAVVRGARAGTERTGVVVRLVAVALRSHSPDVAADVATEAVGFAGDGLTGWDLAGQEERFPDPRRFDRAYAIAQASGLGITIHAGEWGGPAQVRRALAVRPSRIAHGAPAADDPALVAELARLDVTLDLCPTSNVQASIVPTLADHPLPRLLRAGVPVTLSTDDRTVSDLTLTREYARAMVQLGVTLPELWRMNLHALRVAFLHHDEPMRERLRQEFAAFVAEEPALEHGVSVEQQPPEHAS